MSVPPSDYTPLLEFGFTRQMIACYASLYWDLKIASQLASELGVPPL